MKFLLKLCFIFAVILILIAPFTFLPPKTDVVAEKVLLPEPVKKVRPVKVKPKEKPLHSIKLPVFSEITDTHEKKTAFFNFIKPVVFKVNQVIAKKRKRLLAIDEKLGMEEPLTQQDLDFIAKELKEYNVKGADTPFQKIEKLLASVDIVPTELVLVQAANESAWGTSRFARIGLNFFGLWCYKKGCGMVPNARDTGGKHEVAAFKSVEAAVTGYLHNINTHYAYTVFRSIRKQLREQDQPLAPEILATGLLPYSERGVDYVSDIIDMLRHNASYIKPLKQGSIKANNELNTSTVISS